MADPVTNNYGLALPTVGGDLNVWGGIQNNGIFTPIDNILGANYSVSITSADVTLTTTQFQNMLFVVNGTLTAPHALILPFANLGTASSTVTCVGGNFLVQNNGTGAFNLTVKTATTGNGVTVPQGFVASLYSDGVNVGYAVNGLPGYAAASNGNPNGQLAGTAGSVNTNVSIAFDYANALPYFCTTSGTSGSAVWSQPNITVTRGFDTAVNLAFTTAVSANVLTITAVAANTNTTPSAVNPIIVPFRDSTLANGDIVTVNVTGSLSISTFTTGASLGAQNSTPFRFWIVMLNNSGGAVLGLINCVSSTQTFSLNEMGRANTLGMTSGASSAGVFYTPNGVSLSATVFRIVGLLTYETGLVTAGTYNNGPTEVQVFGPGIKKPGDRVSEQFVINPAYATAAITPYTPSGTSPTTAQSILGASAIVQPSSAANVLRVNGQVLVGGSGASKATGFIVNGTTLVAVSAAIMETSVSGLGTPNVSYRGLAATTAQLTFSIYATCDGAGVSVNGYTGTQYFASLANTFISVEEIMG